MYIVTFKDASDALEKVVIFLADVSSSDIRTLTILA